MKYKPDKKVKLQDKKSSYLPSTNLIYTLFNFIQNGSQVINHIEQLKSNSIEFIENKNSKRLNSFDKKVK